MDRGIKTKLARLINVTPQCIYNGISRGSFGKDAARRLADATGIDERIWLYGPSDKIRRAIANLAAQRRLS